MLLDFDGPVCAAFTTITDSRIADALRQYMGEHGHPPPAALRDTTEPLDVLAYTTGVSAELATAVEAELTRWECHAVRYADPTPHVRDVLVWLADSARSVTVVSNNATSSIEKYLHSVELEAMVSGISARTPENMSRLKPDPHLLQEAIAAHGATPDRYVMIGDSSSDIEAAHASGTASIGYANKPGSAEKLSSYQPTALIHDMIELLTTDTIQ